MAGYYDQLEAQLARATTRGVPRRRSVPRLAVPRLGGDWLAVAVALGVCIAVSLVLIVGLGSHHHNRQPAVQVHRHAGPPVIRNYAPGNVPPLGGQLYCDTALRAPRGAGSATGALVVNNRPPTAYVYSLTASGLKPPPKGEVYEVWTLVEVNLANNGHQLENGVPPTLLGVIEPTVGADGRLAGEGLIPLSFNGTYRILITVQPPSSKTPGHIVLEGDVPL
jgi:hypothetical protein